MVKMLSKQQMVTESKHINLLLQIHSAINNAPYLTGKTRHACALSGNPELHTCEAYSYFIYQWMSEAASVHCRGELPCIIKTVKRIICTHLKSIKICHDHLHLMSSDCTKHR